MFNNLDGPPRSPRRPRRSCRGVPCHGAVQPPQARRRPGNAQRDEHLRTGDFCDTEHHQDIVFRSTATDQVDESTYRMTGDQTIKDVTHRRPPGCACRLPPSPYATWSYS
jgi:hypothetical protein